LGDLKYVRRILFFVLALSAFAVSSSVFAQPSENGNLVSRTESSIPPFEQIKGPEKQYSAEEYDRAISDKAFILERLRYTSDGLTVSAFLYRPKTAKGKLPLIVFNRGGYIREDIGAALVPLFHRLAKEGFVIIAPMYRGSDGASGKDEVGGGDLNDLMNVVPLVKSLEFVDPQNVFLYGESRGGTMVFQALRDGFPANAAATFGAFSDFQGFVGARPEIYLPLLRSIWDDYDSRKEEVAKRRSAMMWADKINAPVLLMHGGNDRAVDPLQTLTLAREFQRLNKKYELMVYAGDDHTLTANRIERDSRAVQWFKKHIK
jgi:dipeptidyl aminopeptidase/acylaminoacyl peptidase